MKFIVIKQEEKYIRMCSPSWNFQLRATLQPFQQRFGAFWLSVFHPELDM